MSKFISMFEIINSEINKGIIKRHSYLQENDLAWNE